MAKFSGRLRKAPVVLALCQVTFPTVGSLDDALAEAVHKPLRSDYPYLHPQEVTEITLHSAGVGAMPKAISRRSWSMLDRRKQSGFIFGPTMFVYRTCAYDDFGHFRAQTLRGLECALSILEPAVIERVGLRYVDLIESAAGEQLDQYLEPPLHGFRPQVEGFQPSVIQQLIRGKTKDGELVFRFSRGVHTSPLPVDLMDPMLANLRIPVSDRESLFIDIDHYRENADLDPDVPSLGTLISTLQEPMSLLFKDAVSQYAIDTWNKA